MKKAFPDGGEKFQDIVPCLSSGKVKTIFRKQNEMWQIGLDTRQILTPLRICDQ